MSDVATIPRCGVRGYAYRDDLECWQWECVSEESRTGFVAQDKGRSHLAKQYPRNPSDLAPLDSHIAHHREQRGGWPRRGHRTRSQIPQQRPPRCPDAPGGGAATSEQVNIRSVHQKYTRVPCRVLCNGLPDAIEFTVGRSVAISDVWPNNSLPLAIAGRVLRGFDPGWSFCGPQGLLGMIFSKWYKQTRQCCLVSRTNEGFPVFTFNSCLLQFESSGWRLRSAATLR
jgi:hypothetical protein